MYSQFPSLEENAGAFPASAVYTSSALVAAGSAVVPVMVEIGTRTRAAVSPDLVSAVAIVVSVYHEIDADVAA